MTKEELVHITLKQLKESFASTPENFRLEDPANGNTTGSFPGPTIIWQFKVKIDDSRYISDPLNSTKTIIVSYNKMAKQLSCHIYSREVNSLNSAMMPDTQTLVQYSEFYPAFFNRTYRQFCNLKKSIIKRKNDKEYSDYMKKLSQIFPTTGDEDLF